MATNVQKITLSPSRDIPFNKLLLSQSNVRRVKAGVSVEELADDIARRGLLQGLSVRAVVDQAGVETGMFEIPAGGRRYRALELLVKQKLFERRRDLFTDLSLVFMDTTSLCFYGEGGETLGRRGHSKDYRPDLAQMILALVIDAERAANLHRDGAGQQRRREDPDAGGHAPARALRHHPRLRGRRPRHDQCRNHRRAGSARHGIHPRRPRALQPGDP